MQKKAIVYTRKIIGKAKSSPSNNCRSLHISPVWNRALWGPLARPGINHIAWPLLDGIIHSNVKEIWIWGSKMLFAILLVSHIGQIKSIQVTLENILIWGFHLFLKSCIFLFFYTKTDYATNHIILADHSTYNYDLFSYPMHAPSSIFRCPTTTGLTVMFAFLVPIRVSFLPLTWNMRGNQVGCCFK